MITEKEQHSDLSAFLNFIKSNFRTLLIYSIIGAVLGLTLSLFIPKEYKSYGIVYPPSSTSIDNSIEFPNFGYDLEADRLIQILGSKEIRDSVNKKFDLVSHFEINKEGPEWLDNFVKLYHKHILFERSSSMSVIISANTRDPELSAQVVNFIIASADGLRERIYKKNINSAYENARIDYELQKKRVDSTEVLLVESLKRNNLSSLLMLMSDAQISIDMDKLNSSDLSGVRATIGSELLAFKSSYEVLKEYKSRYIKIKKSFINPIPKLFVINYAEVFHKKTSPSVLLNILLGAVFSLFAATVILLLKHSYATK